MRPGGEVWLITLHDTAEHTWDDAHCRTDLSPAEKRRAEGFRRPDAAVTYVRARSAIRTVLAHVVDETPAGLRIDVTSDGGPVLADHPDLCVSWSTTPGVLLVAVGRRVRIGVDVEVMRAVRSPARVLRTFYPDVRALGEFGDPETFFSAWTLLEAAVKATGRGLARGAREVRLYRAPGAVRCGLAGIQEVDGVAWSGRTDRFAVPGSSAEVMTAVVTGGATVPVRPRAWSIPNSCLSGRR